MNAEQIARARRAVACRGWRWMPGMRYTIWPGMTLRVPDTTPFAAPNGALPDLTDPATLGCLLALVREAHGRHCYAQFCGGYWSVQNADTEEAWGDCATEAEALVGALENAPA